MTTTPNPDAVFTYAEPIVSATAAMTALVAMAEGRVLFHPDDDAAEIVTGTAGTRLFDDRQADRANEIMAGVFTYLSVDPYALVMSLEADLEADLDA